MSYHVEFVGSFPSVEQCPAIKKPEYAFIGRSNVGKSSLINALLERRQAARVSGTPGKTQTINLFTIDQKWVIADLPGYGYAKVSKKSREKWRRMIDRYLKGRPNLTLTFVLVDLRLPPQEIDIEFINGLGANEIPFAIIFTKSDKVKTVKAQNNLTLFEEAMLKHWEELPPVFMTSAKSGEGREEVLLYIEDLNHLWTKDQA